MCRRIFKSITIKSNTEIQKLRNINLIMQFGHPFKINFKYMNEKTTTTEFKRVAGLFRGGRGGKGPLSLIA